MPKKLIISLGSGNNAKLRAARKAFGKCGIPADIKAFDVPSGVRPQPKSIPEIVKGAENRARNAYRKGKCNYSIGIEAGIFKFPSRTGYMDISMCALFDGKRFYYGGSPVFEYPKFIVKKIFAEKKEIGDIINEHLNRKDVKHKEGVIGWLSKGIIDREEYMSLGIIMCIVALKNKGLY